MFLKNNPSFTQKKVSLKGPYSIISYSILNCENKNLQNSENQCPSAQIIFLQFSIFALANIRADKLYNSSLLMGIFLLQKRLEINSIQANLALKLSLTLKLLEILIEFSGSKA